jgi:acyl dehydratase
MGEATFTARNFATASENKIHDDAVAKQYGFRGGLVPGVTSYGYLAEAVLRERGERFLTGGALAVRFGSPVYEGERVTAVVDPAGPMTLRNDSGEECVTGHVGAAEPDARPAPASAPLPDHRPGADEHNLAVGTTLGSLHEVATHEAVDGYLAAIELRSSLRDVVHPAWLLLAANNILVQNVLLGPWIHVGSEVSLVRPAAYDEVVETRAEVTGQWERKGHRFVELDVANLVDDVVITRVRHTAIYQLRS